MFNNEKIKKQQKIIGVNPKEKKMRNCSRVKELNFFDILCLQA